jgi:serine/threonine protein kinase
MENTQKFGRYTVVKMLGEGAMGKVYLAHDPFLERKVALKVISIDAMVDKTVREDYLKRFSFEAKASAKLNHPSIVAVYDAGEENGVPWIAFEFVQGETLESLINRHGRLPIARALGFAHDIASALQHAHGWSIIHRDIKPANILIESSTGIAKLADFGIVKAPWAVMSHDENTLGSPGYMSPEQYDGVDLDERADLFCLGVVIYQMLTGEHPFLRDTMAATMFATCNNEYTPLSDIIDAVPPALDWAVRRCCAADRDKRLRSADELIEMLNKAGDPRPQENRVPPLSGTKAGLKPGTSAVIAAAPKAETVRQNRPPTVSTPINSGFDHSIAKNISLFQETLSLIGTDFLPVMADLIKAFFSRTKQILSRTSFPRQLKIKSVSPLLVAAAAFSAVVIVGIVIMALLSGNGPALPSKDSLQGQLIRQCGIALQENNRVLAMNTADGLSSINPRHPLADILMARVNIRNGRYEEAKAGLLRVQSEKGGNNILQKQVPAILDDISRQLKSGPADPILFEMVRYVLLAGRHPVVRSWVKSPSYWLRWNAVDILKMSNIKIDMTSIYIQDLSCRDMLQIRLQAVSRLRTSDDRRAIDALREAAMRGASDPIVAQNAKRVLDEKER